MLKPEEKERLQKRAYQLQLNALPDIFDPTQAERFLKSPRPEWIKDSDYERRRSIAQKSLELDINITKYNQLMGVMNSLSNQRPLCAAKPPTISDEEWKTFIEMDKTLRLLKAENERIERELFKEKQDVMGLKEKVERQLNTIHIFLGDPTVLDRLEDYNNIFAPGNLENLQKIARLMKDASATK